MQIDQQAVYEGSAVVLRKEMDLLKRRFTQRMQIVVSVAFKYSYRHLSALRNMAFKSEGIWAEKGEESSAAGKVNDKIAQLFVLYSRRWRSNRRSNSLGGRNGDIIG